MRALRDVLGRWPWLDVTVRAWRANRLVAHLEGQWGCDRVAAAVIARIGDARCAAGPFEGLRLPKSTWRRHISPKLLGTYESELFAAFAACEARRPQRVVNIGAGDGFYAVGFSRRWHVPAIAFEADPAARRTVRQMAALNGVQVDVRGPASRRALQHAIGPATVVMCDCEGAEDVLLDPSTVPALADSDLIVELHEMAATGVGDHLRARFAATHDVVAIDAVKEKTPPALVSDLPAADRALAVREHRVDGRRWLFLTTRRSGPTRI